jgi:asparagine synthase (glutamine-hydrolysing)
MSGEAAFAGFVDLAQARVALSGGAPGWRLEDDASGRRVVGGGIDIRAARASLAAEGACVAIAVGTRSAAEWLRAYRERGAGCVSEARGPFAVVIVDLEGTIIGAVDRFAIRPLCYAVEGARFAFADRADAVPLRETHEIEPQALFDYLYFHVIPAPRTIFRGVARLQNGHAVRFEGERATASPHWVPRFAEDGAAPVAALAEEFRAIVRGAVAREAGAGAAGAFLSGGTDSSTVAGMLGAVTGAPARTYSIGFDAEGYDEMAYARIAAKHFRTEHHEYYVTPDDIVRGIPLVAADYDQPFGNSSAVPAYYCALRAREDGVERLLAGDGGDELFGGNSRYAKQRVFGAYDALPGALRRGLVEPVVDAVPALGRVPLARKAASYVQQARVPMPDRIQSYNLLERLGVREVLTPQLLERVDPGEPLARQRQVYGASTARALVNRMLEYDWKYTLADNDLPKVCGTTALAGVAAGFPLLADELVDFSLRLPPDLKLKGLRLRYFFKEALRGFLPDEILAKKKHGFGLPFGVWVASHPALRAFALQALARLGERNVVRADFLASLGGERLRERPGYYGEMIWILVALEHWLERRAPGFAVR